MTLIFAYQNRTIYKDITVLDADGDTVTPGTSDEIRATILRLEETAELTVTSAASTANGSSFTKGAENRLKLDNADLAEIEPGVYSIIFDFYDSVDSEWKNIDRQVFILERT